MTELTYEIYLDKGETSNKCTIAPLSYRSDFRLITHGCPPEQRVFLSPLLLHPDGECFAEKQNEDSKAYFGLAAVDCVWRRLPEILSSFQKPLPQLRKIPQDFQTAYPRKSQFQLDPQGGLATIEALFIGAAFLGHWDLTLLEKYYFAGPFLDLNKQVFLKYGIEEARLATTLPPPTVLERNSALRRRARGRVPPQITQT